CSISSRTSWVSWPCRKSRACGPLKRMAPKIGVFATGGEFGIFSNRSIWLCQVDSGRLADHSAACECPMGSQEPQRPLSPHLQVSRPQYTMVLSFSHRLTGVLLSAGSLLLVYWLWALAGGEQHYIQAMAWLNTGWVKLLLIG